MKTMAEIASLLYPSMKVSAPGAVSANVAPVVNDELDVYDALAVRVEPEELEPAAAPGPAPVPRRAPPQSLVGGMLSTWPEFGRIMERDTNAALEENAEATRSLMESERRIRMGRE